MVITYGFKKLTSLSLSHINKNNKLPALLIIDDTIIKKFHAISNLYDHSITDGQNKYVNGHCFVCIVLAIPVLIKGNINYIRVPVVLNFGCLKINLMSIKLKLILLMN